MELLLSKVGGGRNAYCYRCKGISYIIHILNGLRAENRPFILKFFYLLPAE